MKKNTKRKGGNVFSLVVFGLLVVAEALAVFEVWQLKMLPTKYFLVLVAAIGLVTLLIGAMMLKRRGKWQKKSVSFKQIVAYILSFLIILGCLAGVSAVGKVGDAIAAITTNTVNVLMNVYVLNEDSAQAVTDMADYVLGITDAVGAEQNRNALDDIEAKLGAPISTRSYGSVYAMVDALYSGEVNAILLDESYVGILEELEGYSDFATRTRLLHEHITQKKVNIIVKNDEEEEEQAVVEVMDPTKDPFLLYISGNDSRRQLLADGGSDVNILVAVNPVTKQILMVNTPRDYFIPNPAGEGALDKLSHTGLGGIENSVKAISDLYGVRINYYAKINFSGFKTLVNALGGVTVYSDVSFSSGDYTFRKGENHLNGDQALAFARERHNLSGGDNARGKNQMKIITGMINQLSAGNLIANYADILDSLDGMFATSMPADHISALVKMQLSDMASWDIKTFAVTGDNGSDQPWALGGLYAYVMRPHEHMVAHASDLITRMLAGETITDEDLVVS